jgi:hypothetical protein
MRFHLHIHKRYPSLLALGPFAVAAAGQLTLALTLTNAFKAARGCSQPDYLLLRFLRPVRLCSHACLIRSLQLRLCFLLDAWHLVRSLQVFVCVVRSTIGCSSDRVLRHLSTTGDLEHRIGMRAVAIR